MRRLWRTALFIAIALSNALAVGQLANAPVRVTIISVQHFTAAPNDEVLQNKLLSDQFRAAANSLAELFNKRYGIVARRFETAEETTYEAIRRWLRRDFSRDTSLSTHFVFFLTHGFAVDVSGEDRRKSDVFLAGSNTVPSDLEATSIAGFELIQAVKDMRRRSVVLMFLDACGSGAIDSAGLDETLLTNPALSYRFALFSASMPEQRAFGGRFSEALLGLWHSPLQTCHKGPEDIAEFLSDRLKQVRGFDNSLKQHIRVANSQLVHNLCVESLVSEQAVLFLDNNSTEELTVTIESESAPSVQRRLKPQTLTPVAVPSAVLTVTFQSALGQPSYKSRVITNQDFTSTRLKVLQALETTDPMNTVASVERILNGVLQLPSIDVAKPVIQEAIQRTNTADEELKQRLSEAVAEVERASAEVESIRLEAGGSVLAEETHGQGDDGFRRERDAANVSEAQAQLLHQRSIMAQQGLSYAFMERRSVEHEILRTKMAAETAKTALLVPELRQKRAASLTETLNKAGVAAPLRMQVTDRGTEITFPYTNGALASMSKVKWRNLRSFPHLLVEIEIESQGSGTLKERALARRQGQRIARIFKRAGFADSQFVARPVIIPQAADTRSGSGLLVRLVITDDSH